jgi:hypothetical protein
MKTTESVPITTSGHDSYGLGRQIPTELQPEHVLYGDIKRMDDSAVTLEINDSDPIPQLTGDIGVDVFIGMIRDTENPDIDEALTAFKNHDSVVRARLNETLAIADEVLTNALDIETTANKKTTARKAMVNDDCNRRLDQILANEQEAIADLRAKAVKQCEIELVRKKSKLDAIAELEETTLVLVQGTRVGVSVVNQKTKINLSLQDGHENRRRQGFEDREKYFNRRKELPAIIATNKEELARLSGLIDDGKDREREYFADRRNFEDALKRERSEDPAAKAKIAYMKTAFPDATESVDEQTRQILADVSNVNIVQIENDISMLSLSIRYNTETHVVHVKSHSRLSLVVSDLELELRNIYSYIDEVSENLAQELGTPILEIENDSKFMLQTAQQIANPLAIKPALPGERLPAKIVETVYKAAVDLRSLGTSHKEQPSVEAVEPTFEDVNIFMPSYEQNDDAKTLDVVAQRKLMDKVTSQVEVIRAVLSLGAAGLKGILEPTTAVAIRDKEPRK